MTNTQIITTEVRNFTSLRSYPSYITFEHVGKLPTCVDQKFEKNLILEESKIFYPKIDKLEAYFSSEYESLRFGAAQFCGFLHDTIAVEHSIVIPAIRDLYKLPFHIPVQPIEDLFKLITDEGHHAAQALSFINIIKQHFDLEICENGDKLPLFLRRLEKQKSELSSDLDKSLFTMIIGIVTETRISKELGQFTNNEYIISAVRENCSSHQHDETIHASQFRALGEWSWSQFDDEQKELAAELYAKTTIARSLPDISRIAFYMSQVTSYSRERCDKIVNKIFTPDVIREEMLIAARPTIFFLRKLGVLDFKVAREIFTKAGVTV